MFLTIILLYFPSFGIILFNLYFFPRKKRLFQRSGNFALTRKSTRKVEEKKSSLSWKTTLNITGKRGRNWFQVVVNYCGICYFSNNTSNCQRCFLLNAYQWLVSKNVTITYLNFSNLSNK